MQLKVNNKYKRVGTTYGFATKTGEVVTITHITNNHVDFCPIENLLEKRALQKVKFNKEFILYYKLSFKGILSE